MKRIVILFGLILSACDPGTPPQPETGREPNPAFEAQIQAMEKARAAEQQMKDAAEAQRKQMDEAAQ